MFNAVATADAVCSWPGLLGVKLPKELTGAIATLNTVRYADTRPVPVKSVGDITAENAEQRIRAFAHDLVLSTGPGGGGTGPSPLQQAHDRFRDMAAGEVLAAARQALPDIFNQLRSGFGQVAAEFIDAVSRLPETFTADSLLAAGSAVVGEYNRALSLAGSLDRINAWVGSTGELWGVWGSQRESVIRILRPTNGLQLAKLDEAHELRSTNHYSPPMKALGPVLVTAVRYEVPFGINTLHECSRIRDDLKLTPQALQHA